MKKTSEYVEKYQLHKNDKFNHHSFAKDLGKNFDQLCVLNKAGTSRDRFYQTVKEIRKKFDAINNKTKGCIEETVWSYFYATKIIPKRDLYFSEETIEVSYS